MPPPDTLNFAEWSPPAAPLAAFIVTLPATEAPGARIAAGGETE